MGANAESRRAEGHVAEEAEPIMMPMEHGALVVRPATKSHKRVRKEEEPKKPAKTTPTAVLELAEQMARHSEAAHSAGGQCHAADLTLTQLWEIRHEYWGLPNEPQRLEWLTHHLSQMPIGEGCARSPAP